MNIKFRVIIGRDEEEVESGAYAFDNTYQLSERLLSFRIINQIGESARKNFLKKFVGRDSGETFVITGFVLVPG